MQTSISPLFQNTDSGKEADQILRKCVHCGFCNATCPTYQLLGDELDGPRGRIYLIKQVMEGEKPNKKMNLHLDRCLTCRNCETTCPSGVEYSKLLGIGRHIVAQEMDRSISDRFGRNLIAFLLRHPRLFSVLITVGRMVRPLLPEWLRDKVPSGISSPSYAWPEAKHPRKMIALAGCAQSSLTPGTNRATAMVLDKLGISLIEISGAGCCGAVDLHTTREDKARDVARNLIDKWWPHIQPGHVRPGKEEIEAFVMTASGCGITIKEYPDLFRYDAQYFEKAKVISAMTLDLCEILDQEIDSNYQVKHSGLNVAFHPPCTLQHGQKLSGRVEAILSRAGYNLVAIADSHLCCGSAGTYSLFQPELSASLKENKLNAIDAAKADVVCTANIGCQMHLSHSDIPVKHWIELLI